MVEVIPKPLKHVWDTWNVRGMIILSLALQTILVFFAPSRKRTPNKFLILLLWSSYLLADLSANYAVSLIAKNLVKGPKPDDPPQDKKLFALWAPFLLLHLGGQDTITAFSLEDNTLWARHLLHLVAQGLSGIFVILQSIRNRLWVIVLLLYIAGFFKYWERSAALFIASSDRFRGGSMIEAFKPGFDPTEQTKNLDMDSAQATEVYMKEHHGQPKPLTLMHPHRELTHLEILQYAFLFFDNFKSFMVNNIFSLELRNSSKWFFSALQLKEEALRIIEAELDFIYEGLYTKAAVLHTRIGLVFRFMSLGSFLSAFIIYHHRHNKTEEFHKADIVITYTLFFAGLALDVISLCMFVLSDWTTAILLTLKDEPNKIYSWNQRILNWILFLKRPKMPSQTYGEEDQQEVLNTPFLRRKWTGSITMFNFITLSMNADAKRIHKPRGGTCQLLRKTVFSPFSYVFSTIMTCVGNIAVWFRDLHQYIINLPPGENQAVRSIVSIFKTFVGFWFHVPYFLLFLLTSVINFLGIKDLLPETRLVRSVHQEPLTKSLWSFVFTELQDKSEILDGVDSSRARSSARGNWTSSHTQIQVADDDKLLRYIADVDYDHSLLVWHIATELCYQEEEEVSAKEKCDDRKTSKMLSDYMMYLLIMQPKLMSELAGIGRTRLRDTLAEAERFYEKMGIRDSRDVKLASKIILSVDTSIEPIYVKGNDSKSVLFEASSVAKELQRLEKEFGKDKWKTLSKVWSGFLFHAASNCDGPARMELLSKGGEFINFVWLLMAHFDLMD